MNTKQSLPFRYERKYLTNHFDYEIRNMLKLHEACFKKIFHTRSVHSIYFDTPDLNLYSDHVNGANNRFKLRLRFYDNKSSYQQAYSDKLSNSQLEIKIKQNHLIKKHIFPISNFPLDNISLNHDSILNYRNHFPLSIDSSLFTPLVLVSYNRSYFLSQDNNFRITIDSSINFSPIINNRLNPGFYHHLPYNIIELKYDQSLDSQVCLIAKYFPFRISKSSKYVYALDYCFQPSL